MSCLMGSQGLVLATAVAVSAGTVVLFDLLRQKYLSIAQLELTKNVQNSPQEKRPILRSCLSSGEKNMNSTKKKKKKVQFAANLKDSNRGEYGNSYEKEILGMPANRRALYIKILKNRIHRMDISVIDQKYRKGKTESN